MNYSTSVFLINDKMRCIRCQYDPTEGVKLSSPSDFKTDDATIKKDDLVVVLTGTRAGMTVVKVIDVDVPVDFNSIAPMPWIVQRVDQDAHARKLAEEAQAIDLIRLADVQQRQKELSTALFNAHPDLRAKLGGLSIAALPPSN